LLCDEHHLEFAARFIDTEGSIEHTARATWARIEAAQPLVLRDDQDFWTRGLARLLTDWPLGDAATRRDVERWVAEVEREPVEAGSDLLDRLDQALDRLKLPSRRRRRLVRAFKASIAEIRTMTPRQLREIGLKAREGPDGGANEGGSGD
jgi:hypothetical protein